MFHGLSTRGAIGYPHHKNYNLGEKLSVGLEITKNVHNLADVFSPSNNWVLSPRVKAKLQSLPHIHFLPVKFNRAVLYPFEAGDKSYEHDARYAILPPQEAPERFLQLLPAVSPPPDEYSEMIVARLSDIQSGFKDLVTINYDLTDTSQASREVRLSEDLLREYPVVWYYDHFLSAAAYDLVAEYINRDYYYVQEIQCP